uniref:Uncharacterized protein n=1 Tax=Anguilla anguilla TaxID=7936 RepID=A0A0E9PSB6_ANGAN
MRFALMHAWSLLRNQFSFLEGLFIHEKMSKIPFNVAYINDTTVS